MATTLEQLRQQARQRADMENSEFVEDSELDLYINDSLKELYDLLVSKFEDYYVEDPLPFTLAQGVSSYALPTNFYKLLGVDRSTGGDPNDNDSWYVLRPFSWEDRNNQRNADRYRGIYPNVKYRVMGNLLRMTPTDQAQGLYRMWYVPSCGTLVDDTDEVQVQMDRWIVYVVTDVAIKMLAKEESDISALVMQKRDLAKRIEDMAQNRDAGETQRVTDVSRSGNDDPLYYRW